MEFHASLPVEYFKAFTATIDLFLQFSELVNIDVRNNQLILSTLNHSRTAQALARLSPTFFQEYKLLRKGSPETSIQCTVLNKSLNSILKKNFGNIASIKMCRISIIPGKMDDEGHVTSKITMQLIYKNDSKKTNTLTYTDGDRITPLYNTDNLHHFVMYTENIRDCFSRFDTRVSDIVLQCTPHSITISTYSDPSKGIRTSRYSYTIDSELCTEYSVIEPVKIVCNLKEFHAVVDFMDFMNTPIHANFEDVGKPILFTYRLEGKLMLDIALMSQMDETDTNRNNTEHADIQIPNIREPTSRNFNYQSPSSQHSSQPSNTNANTPSRAQQIDIRSMIRPSQESPVMSRGDQSRENYIMSSIERGNNQAMSSIEKDRDHAISSTERIESNHIVSSIGRTGSNQVISSTETVSMTDRLNESTEEPLFYHHANVNSEQEGYIRQSTPASRRLTTLQKLREKRRGLSPTLNMNNPTFVSSEASSGERRNEAFFPFDSNTTPEPRSSRDTSESIPYIKQESSSRPRKKRFCMNEDSE